MKENDADDRHTETLAMERLKELATSKAFGLEGYLQPRRSHPSLRSQWQLKLHQWPRTSCRNTKTQVNPSSALNRTKHHQSNPSIVPGILDSNLSRRACMHSSKFLITWSNRITSYNRIRFFNRFPSFRFYYFPGLLNLCCTRQRGLPLLFREAGFTAPSGTYSGRRPTIRDLNLHTLIYF